MTETPDPKKGPFKTIKLFTDPTPQSVLNHRLLVTMLQFVNYTTLTKEESDLYIRIVILIAHKMGSVWTHKQRYFREQERILAGLRAEILGPNVVSEHAGLSQELFVEFDEFLVQIKSTLDHLVYVMVPMVGRNVWNLRTFGSKGEEVLRALKSNLPNKYKHAARAFERAVFEHHKDWLEQVITLRDRANHFLDGGLSSHAFSVVKEGDVLHVPMLTKEQSVADFMNIVWHNFFAFVEDFIALSLSLRMKEEVVLFMSARKHADTPESPWRVISKGDMDKMIQNPGWKPA